MSTVPLFDHAKQPEQLDTDDESGSPRCENCGTVVTHAYVRVFGETNDELQHCHACKSRTERY